MHEQPNFGFNRNMCRTGSGVAIVVLLLLGPIVEADPVPLYHGPLRRGGSYTTNRPQKVFQAAPRMLIFVKESIRHEMTSKGPSDVLVSNAHRWNKKH
jgi:hypothetical protein